MHINFHILDDENTYMINKFSIYCTNNLLKILKLNKNENVIISRQLKNEENKFNVCCCFKNYEELKLKHLDNYSVYTNKWVLKCLNVDINKNQKCITLDVQIIKCEIYIPIKKIEIQLYDIINHTYIMDNYSEEIYTDFLLKFWKNIKNKNMEKYINLSMLNVCLFKNNFISINILGVETHLFVKELIFEKSKKLSNILNNNYIPYINENTKIIILEKEQELEQEIKQEIKENLENEIKQKIKKNVENETNLKNTKIKNNLQNKLLDDINEQQKCKEKKYKLFKINNTKMGLNKIGGYNKIKEEIYYYIILPLIYKNIYEKYHIDINKGILFYGPPGCGKTYFALAIKEELELLKKKLNQNKIKNKIKLMRSINEIKKIENKNENENENKLKKNNDNYNNIKNINNETEKIEIKNENIDEFILPEMEILKSTDLIDQNNNGEKINELFFRCYKRYKEENKCSIIFIDEIEILCEKREESIDKNLYTTTLLNNMDGIKKNNNIILIGATNYINKIDLALRRTGRFEKDIEINIPKTRDRIKILKKKLSKIKHNLTINQIKKIAHLSQSFTCSDINSLINISMFLYLKTNKKIYKNIFYQKFFKDYILKYKHIKKAIKYVKPSGMKELYIDIPQTKINDIGGYKYIKKYIKETLIYPQKYQKLYKKYNIKIPKGILLYGPPGCSKTLFAKAIANEINMNFISIKGPEIFSKYVGESEKQIRYIFKKARENNPCIIFFDEIDSISMNRDYNNFVSNRVLCQLLNEIDGISDSNVLILAATNRPDLIDPALLRAGRFDRMIFVPLPNYSSRLSIFKKTLKYYKVNNIIKIKNSNTFIKLNNKKNEKYYFELNNIYSNENNQIELNEKKYSSNNINTLEIEENEKKYSSNNINTLEIEENKKKYSSNNINTLEIEENEKNYFNQLCIWLAKKTKKYSGAEIVNICREASICALRQTLKKIKKKKKMRENIKKDINCLDDYVKLSKKHFYNVLKKVKPQTPSELINFYKKYNKQK